MSACKALGQHRVVLARPGVPRSRRHASADDQQSALHRLDSLAEREAVAGRLQRVVRQHAC